MASKANLTCANTERYWYFIHLIPILNGKSIVLKKFHLTASFEVSIVLKTYLIATWTPLREGTELSISVISIADNPSIINNIVNVSNHKGTIDIVSYCGNLVPIPRCQYIILCCLAEP